MIFVPQRPAPKTSPSAANHPPPTSLASAACRPQLQLDLCRRPPFVRKFPNHLCPSPSSSSTRQQPPTAVRLPHHPQLSSPSARLPHLCQPQPPAAFQKK
ncbi:unnamed protein product [Cuscuta epithymum]|uniref:Uncharacterized protein n=1 Tax=Cuscuta epithymum TaxID=186058 RepID=A0AAV0CSV6_9ASTE|nr:unnamed protein product [Cuscuta epithymum]